MAGDYDVQADLVGELAAALEWHPGEDEATALAAPVEGLLESTQPDLPEPVVDSVPDRSSAPGGDDYNAFIRTCEVERTGAGPLAGVEIGIKDNTAVAGIELTAGSALLEGCTPTRDAPVVDRLLEAGGRIVGKTNMDEFAFGPTGETSHFGPALNPVDPDRSPGGSSSGSGAAVAAGLVDLALGTDTGGSVRIPASYCGVIGFKPTLGTVPTADVVELAGSLDTVGLLAKSMDLVDRGFTAMAGLESDSRGPAPELDRLEIGVPASLHDDPVDTAVTDRVAESIAQIGSAGAIARTVELPDRATTSAVWRTITMSELYAYFLADTCPYRVRDGEATAFNDAFRTARRDRLDHLSDPLKQYLLVGSYLVNVDRNAAYAAALDCRRRVRTEVEAVFESVDVVITPTTPTTAVAFEEFSRESSHPINAHTHPFNLSGHPAASIPCGEVDGLPVGLQLVGQRGADRDLIATADRVLDAIDAA